MVTVACLQDYPVFGPPVWTVPALRCCRSMDGDGAICPRGEGGVGSLTSEPKLRSKWGQKRDISGITKLCPFKQSDCGYFVLQKSKENKSKWTYADSKTVYKQMFILSVCFSGNHLCHNRAPELSEWSFRPGEDWRKATIIHGNHHSSWPSYELNDLTE